jgi:hypothetical protein
LVNNQGETVLPYPNDNNFEERRQQGNPYTEDFPAGCLSEENIPGFGNSRDARQDSEN